MGEIWLATVLETAGPIIWWLNIILEFATSIEDASFVLGRQYHVRPGSEEATGQMIEQQKAD